MKLTATSFLAFVLYLLAFTTAVPLTNTTLPQNITDLLKATMNAEADAAAKCKPRDGPCSVNQDCCDWRCCCQTEVIPIVNRLTPMAPPLMVNTGFCCDDTKACFNLPEPDPDPPKED